MELIMIKTYSQSSQLWNEATRQPITLNCPVTPVGTWASSDRGVAVGSEPPTPRQAPRGSLRAQAEKKADLIADRIHAVAASATQEEGDSPRPTDDVLAKAINLVGTVKESLLGDPDVDASDGEVHLTWHKGTKQVVLMALAEQDPLVHHYQRIKGASSKHAIEPANSKSLSRWLRWLHE